MAMARQFFDAQNASGPGPSFSPAQIAPIQDLASRQLPIVPTSRHATPFFNGARAETERVPSLPQSTVSPASWASEFNSGVFTPGSSVHQSITPAKAMQSPHVTGNAFGTVSNRFGLNLVPQNYRQGFEARSPVFDIKGKGKIKVTDFDAAFAQVVSSLETAPAKAEPTSGSVDPVEELERGLNQAKLDDVPVGTQEEAMRHVDFKSVWDQMQNSDMPPTPEEFSRWEAEFNQLMNAHREDGEWDLSAAMQRTWEEGSASLDDTFAHNVKFDHEGFPVLDPYVFEENNKYLDPSSSTLSPLAQAKQMLEENASLSEVALLLEAAIQKGDLGEGGYEAWILLGETRNMDEREEGGMKALTEGVRLAEEAGSTGAGMLSLAISYTNESFDRASHSMLLRWLRARFPDVSIPPDAQEATTKSSWHSHDIVTEVFLNVARTQHAQGVIDPDVQLALGVLFYSNNAYDRARDCFEAALSIRPTDYLLWNRLGSSLSNGNKPEESLGAYREALMLHPTYTRAIYNVGVACLNIGAHKEAAEHFLSALSMQETTGEKSKQLLQTLRRAFLAMDRKDLADLTDENPNLDYYRTEGFEF
jgi:peroxin-5